MTTNVVLILGGTREAAQLAQKLVEENPKARIISSLAGRTREPKPIAGEIRIGGFGGADGLTNYIRENNVTRLIDATHPFAVNISRNAAIAAANTGIVFEIRRRAPWPKLKDDHWWEVEDLEAACAAIPAQAKVLLALGSQHIAIFTERSDVHFVVRMVDPPETRLPFAKHTLVLGTPGDTEQETALLKKHRITHIVCRNSGGEGAYAKIEAARQLCIPVIIVTPRS